MLKLILFSTFMALTTLARADIFTNITCTNDPLHQIITVSIINHSKTDYATIYDSALVDMKDIKSLKVIKADDQTFAVEGLIESKPISIQIDLMSNQYLNGQIQIGGKSQSSDSACFVGEFEL